MKRIVLCGSRAFKDELLGWEVIPLKGDLEKMFKMI